MDFMYAVTIGSAFPKIEAIGFTYWLWALLFLLVVIVEDFFLYTTQVKPHSADATAFSLFALLFEMSVLITWFLMVVSFQARPRVFLACYAAYFTLKWSAGFFHCRSASLLSTRIFHRNHTFFVPILAALCLLYFARPVTSESRQLWIVIVAAYIFSTVAWWLITPRSTTDAEHSPHSTGNA
jgi:hypothetical protein